ncbi:MAG TPA: winged helix-turn-helix domain-containing protein [Actinomycetota bacterium]
MLSGIWQHGFGLVLAPAGSGKTTSVAQFAAAIENPVAWYRAESSDGDPRTLLAYLEAALSRALPGLAPGWSSAADAASSLEAWPGTRALLVLDDLHVLQGTAAEAELERLLAYMPRKVAVLAASRRPPGFNLSRLRVAGALLELDAEDLRFRAWEVEQLFRDVYAATWPPEALAELARRTEGWAAGLQLFHLATRGKHLNERRRILADLGSRSRLANDYLARNVVQELPPATRAFLVTTCVLGRLSGPLCNELLDAKGSDAVLQALERDQIFTYAVSEQGCYRYHEVLRSHLEAMLVEEVGEEEARRRYRTAAGLLEASGALSDALQGYCRGEDWSSVARLLGTDGSHPTGKPAAWLDLLPAALREQDPWIVLAGARRHRDAGRLQDAIAGYHKAQELFGDQTAAKACRQECQSLSIWLQPSLPGYGDWGMVVRAALSREPLVAMERAATLAGPTARLAAGLAALAAGRVREAEGMLAAVAEAAEAGSLLSVGAGLAATVASLLRDNPDGNPAPDQVSEDAERLGIPWLIRVSRAALALTGKPEQLSEAASVGLACRSEGDVWGSALAGLLEGFGALKAGQPAAGVLGTAAEMFEGLGAECLASWCRSLQALTVVRFSAPPTDWGAARALGQARALGVPASQAFAFQALAETGRGHAGYEGRAQELSKEIGLALPARHPGAPYEPPYLTGASPNPPQTVMRCLGGFSLVLRGRRLDPSPLKPRVRELLRLFALHAGRPVHREVLAEALWPQANSEVATRNLHVGISSLRRVLELADPTRPPLILRDGQAYELTLPDGEVDLIEFDLAVTRARTARAAGDGKTALASYRRTLDLYGGELLPEDGPAEWVVLERERYRSAATEAAQYAGQMLLESNELESAALACARGLQIDRHCDRLWQTRIRAHELAGEAAAAAHARRSYEEVLADLGLHGSGPGEPYGLDLEAGSLRN